jgi:Tfp pilus assembly protein PilP
MLISFGHGKPSQVRAIREAPSKAYSRRAREYFGRNEGKVKIRTIGKDMPSSMDQG